jgi:hypothetical protein
MDQPGRATALRKAVLPGAEVAAFWRIAPRLVGYRLFPAKASVPGRAGAWPGTATTAGWAAPARASNSARATVVVISSYGLKALYSDGATAPTVAQK